MAVYYKRIKNLIALMMAMVLVMTPLICDASSAKENVDKVQQELKDAQSEREQTEKDKKDAENKANSLSKDAEKISGQINSLNNQISTVMGEISATTASIDEVNADIEVVTGELNDVIEKSDAQYEAMKLRIQYMYENSSKSPIIDILETGSLKGMVKKIEYMSAITNYDQNMLEEYADLQAQIQEKKDELTVKQEELKTYEASLADKKSQLNNLVNTASVNLENTKSELTNTQQAIADYDAKIKDMKAKEKELIVSYMEAQIAYAKEIGATGEDTSGALAGYNEADVLMLAAMIEAEAGNQGDDGRLAVGSVIMNRVFSSKFPNSIAEVISAPNQFAPYASGRFGAILSRGPNATCIAAAKACIDGYRRVDSLFFFATWYANQVQDRTGDFYDRTTGEFIRDQYYFNYR